MYILTHKISRPSRHNTLLLIKTKQQSESYPGANVCLRKQEMGKQYSSREPQQIN